MGRISKKSIENSDREKQLNAQIGENLAILRKMKGLTQDQVEKQLGIAEHAVSKFERGSASFTPDIIEMFAKCYRVPKWMLYDQVPDESWYDVYDIALLHILKELPPEDKIIHVAAISNNWAIRHPEKKLHGTFAGRILEYLRAFRELSIK